METSRPTLYLLPEHRNRFTKSFDTTMASLAKYVTLEDSASPVSGDMAEASKIADALDGLFDSSDIDCPYRPCVLTGPDPRDDAFFASLGIARSAMTKVGGYDSVKLQVVTAANSIERWDVERPALALITRLGKSEYEDISDYIEEDEVEAFEAAVEKLGELGPLVHIDLCSDDGSNRVVLTLARRESGTHVGVMTIRQET